MAAEKKDDANDESITLPIPVRVLGGLIAVALLTFCVILVWRGREGGAVISLVVTAGVAGLLALVGTLPSRLIVGGNEAHWRRRFTEEKEQRKTAEAEVEAVAEELSLEELERAADRARAAVAAEERKRQSPIVKIKDFQEQALKRLHAAAKTVGAKVIVDQAIVELPATDGDVARRLQPDAVVRRGDQEVLVEIKRVANQISVHQLRMIAFHHDRPVLVTAPQLKVIYGENDAGRTIFATCPIDTVSLVIALRRIFKGKDERFRS